MDISSDLLRFVKESLLRGNRDISPDDSLIELGIIDSVGLMQLMAFIEERTGRRLPDHCVVPDNFQSVTAMTRMLQELEPNSR